MAKINVLGDAIQLVSDLLTEDIERAKAYKPEALQLKDENGNIKFAVSTGDAHITEHGVVFSSTDAQGRAFVTIYNSVEDHSDPEVEKELLARKFAKPLNTLNELEAAFGRAMEELYDTEAKAKANICFVGEVAPTDAEE